LPTKVLFAARSLMKKALVVSVGATGTRVTVTGKVHELLKVAPRPTLSICTVTL